MMSASTQSTDSTFEILVAEDSPTQALRLQHILQQQGYRVTVTSNGHEALEAARLRKPALIISDVVMPEMDGFELSRQIKEDPDLGTIPIILVTTLSDPMDVLRGLECHADNFILKPYDERTLLNRVRFVLVNSEMRADERAGMGVEIMIDGQKHLIMSEPKQILTLLLSTYEAAIQRNQELEYSREELRSLNTQLQRAIATKDGFLANVSHELRTPLNAIIGFTGTLLMRLPGKLNSEQERQLKNVQSGAQHLHALINDLLDIATITSGKVELKPESVACHEVAEEVIDSMHQLAAAKGLELTINLPQGGITNQTDRRALKQVLLNLVANGIKFTERGSVSLTVDTRVDHGVKWIVFSVTDTGIGVRTEDQDKLFDAFARLETAVTRRTEGTGLGLHLSQQLAHLLRGRIEFESEYGRGSTFKLMIPLT